MKTILFCNLVPNKTGAYERVLAALGERHRQDGDRLVLALAGDPIAELAARLKELGVAWHVIRGWSNGAGEEHPWRFVGAAVRLLRAERPDVAVVHFGNELPSVAANLACRAVGPRNVGWIWEQDQQMGEPSWLTRHVSRIRLAGLFFDRVLAVYEGGRTSLLERGVSAAKIAVVPNAVEDHVPTRERGWLRRAVGVAGDPLLLVSTGWMVRRKRIGFILRGFAGVVCRWEAERGSRPAPHLLLVGEGPERSELQRLAGELALTGRVHFLGLRNDVRDILAESDILVHASVAETCTYAITESMCAGIPAVVTEAGAAREQIADGESGYVVERDDRAAFEERVWSLVADAERRRRFGACARERWRSSYRLDVAAASLHALQRGLAAATTKTLSRTVGQ